MTIEKFIQYIKAEKRYSDHTAIAYRKDIERFVAFLCRKAEIEASQFDPSSVTSNDVREWIMELSLSGLGPSSVNRMTSSLRTYFKWLRKIDAVEKDPFLRVGFQKKPSRLPTYVTENQMDGVLNPPRFESAEDDFVSLRNELMVLLFYTTGMRLAELRQIRVSDFSANFRELKILGKGNKERIIPILEITSDKIKLYIDKIKSERICESSDFFLFLTEKAEVMSRSAIYRIVKEKLTQSGVRGKKSPHVLRHTFATHMLNNGADIKEIQELLGHSSLSATQVYTHNSITKLKEIYASAHPRSVKKDSE